MTTIAAQKVSISELHRITGFDRRIISQKLVASNVSFDKTGRGAHLYDKREALGVLCSDDPTMLGPDDPKRRKIKADADRAELAVQKLRGELVSVDEMRQAAAELIKTMFQRIVHVEPSILAAKCVGLDAVGIESEVRKAMQSVFSDLRFDPSSYITPDKGESLSIGRLTLE